MTRFFFSALAFATLGLAGPAAAEDCLCIGPDSFSDLASVSIGHSLDTAADDVAALEHGAAESPDPLAPVPTAEAAPRGATPVLWCMSPDDPRCQRDDTGEAPHRITMSTAPIAAMVSTPRVPRATSTNVELVSDQGRPLAGVRVRVDRPPRA